MSQTIDYYQYQAAAELTRRRNDGLLMFQAMPQQDDFFTDDASEIGLWGGNRAGKTAAAAVKFAAMIRGLPVRLSTGELVDQRYPWQRDRELIAWIVGLQLNHIGQTIHRVLFRNGLYKIIRDLETHKMRAFNPERDAGRETDTRPSYPLIPESEVEKFAWENAAKKQFTQVTLNNGNEVYAFASTGDVKQGDAVDYIWVDERISRPSHYSEWQARLSDKKGRIVWSSMPWSDNGAMLRLNQRAEEQAYEFDRGERDKITVRTYRLRFSANPNIDDEEKRKRLEGWSEDEKKQRDEGLFLTDNIRIYPSFDRAYHTAIYDDPKMDDAISRILRNRRGEPPREWTRTLIIDPGTAKPAALFCAVPPPELWMENEPYFIPYAEIYKPRLIAAELAKNCKTVAAGYRVRDFIIDGIAARYTPLNFALTVGQNISMEFQKVNFHCTETGTSFMPGDPSFVTRSMCVDRWLRYRDCGRPQLRVVRERCPNLVIQMEQNLKATETGVEGVQIILEKPAKGQRDDVRECLEYYASRHPTWHPQEMYIPEVAGPGLNALNQIKKMFGPKADPSDKVVSFGPGARS